MTDTDKSIKVLIEIADAHIDLLLGMANLVKDILPIEYAKDLNILVYEFQIAMDKAELTNNDIRIEK